MAELKIFSAGSQTAGKVCSICQTGIIAGERIVYCPDCSLPFHHECWRENRGCSVYGCRSAPPTVKADAADGLVSTVWGAEKKCPACGGTIKAEALKCRFCGATFESRELITRDQYARREYDGKEYAGARNKVVLFFLMAVSGCLTVPGAIVLGWLIFRKGIFGVRYARLPWALRGLAIAGFGISCLLMFLLAAVLALD